MADAFATLEGTQRFRQRLAITAPDAHFRTFDSRTLSSLGVGTYLGDADDATDEGYRQAILAAVPLGCNVIDTAINYRHQRSERAVGRAIRALRDEHAILRDELFISTKGGYLPFDGEYPDDPAQYLFETFIQPGLFSTDDLVAGCHCLAPKYLAHQIETSLRNLGLETVDLYYLHNPEQQLDEVPREEFYRRLRAAFRVLEQAVKAGKIRMYGIATWNGLRHAPNARDYLPLEELIALASEVGGAQHHFRAVQLPYNLAMPEALTLRNQPVEGLHVSLLEAAERFRLLVTASASLLQGQLSHRLPDVVAERFSGFQTDAQRAIQFVRSTPGLHVGLIGMKSPAHVEENLAVARTAPLPFEQFQELFAR